MKDLVGKIQFEYKYSSQEKILKLKGKVLNIQILNKLIEEYISESDDEDEEESNSENESEEQEEE